jgi:hypothetical protein
LSEDSLRRGDILFERGFRFLDDGDVIAVLNQNVADAFPTRTVCPGAMNENNIPNSRLLGLG